MRRLTLATFLACFAISLGAQQAPQPQKAPPPGPAPAQVRIIAPVTEGEVGQTVTFRIEAFDAAGAIAPLGTPGEICTRGYSVMLGYWADPERTAEAIDGEGWMHTGDLGTLDAAGYARVTGRIKDMLIRGGENIYPREIEEFLLRHPAIADVQVVGVPDARFGEAVCACVLVKPGASLDKEAVRAFCRGQIAHYKIPEHVLFPEELPMTVTGKVQKFRLREWAARRIVGETVG